MKNFKVIAVWAAVFPLGASCSSGSGQPTVPDARPAPADAAVGPDTRPDLAFVAVEAGRDLATDDLAVDVVVNGPEAGPETQVDTKDAFAPDKPCINPSTGHYAAQSDPPMTTDAWYGANPIFPLNAYGFTISVDPATGLYAFPYSSNNYRWDTVPVTCGEFNFQWGQGIGGTHCPTDGYKISGSFVSPTTVHGHYVTMSNCRTSSEGDYIATLVPGPDAAPRDTQVLDATSQ